MNRLKLLCLSLCLIGLCCATSAMAAKSDAEVEGEKHFTAGLAYIDDPSGPKLEEAYREFHTAYALCPSYKILSNIGYCALHLERDAEAIDAYRKFLASANNKEMTPRQRKQMESDVQMLSASLVTVTLQTVPATVTVVDERFPSKGPAIVNRYNGTNGSIELGIHPGNHKITVSAEGYESRSWEFEAQPATKHQHSFQLSPVGGKKAADKAEDNASKNAQTLDQPSNNRVAPVPSQDKRDYTLAYVGAGATALFAVGATATGLLALSKKDDLADFNRDGLQPEQARAARDDAERYASFTDVGIGAAAVSAGATLYFYLSAPTRKAEAPAPSAWQLSPGVGRNRASIAISGSF